MAGETLVARSQGLAFICLFVSLFVLTSEAATGPRGDPKATSLATRILAESGIKGGLIVHLGCGDGKLTAALRASDSYCVHGLDTEGEDVLKAREYIRSLGLSGKVAVEPFDGAHLPYVDNMVNLLVADRRILAHEQLESLWPVHGSVLVRDGIVHFVAGRSVFVDGGMRLCRLDAKTGKVVSETVLDERNPKTGHDIQELVKWLNMPVGRPDILSCDGKRLYMRSQAFDLEGKRLAMGPKVKGPGEGKSQGGEGTHLFCPTGFLDDTSFHRTYWLYGRTWGSGWCGYYVAGKYAPAGKIICVGDERVYVFGRRPQYYRWTIPMEYRLFAAGKEWKAPEPKTQTDRTGGQKSATKGKRRKRRGPPAPISNKDNYAWSTTVPIFVRAMTLADGTLFIAGPRDVLDESVMGRTLAGRDKLIAKQEAAFQGRDGAVLWAVSADDGRKLAEYPLDSPPVFDGMAAANGRLYLSTTDGKVLCLGGKQ